jgi:uncharacterized protein
LHYTLHLTNNCNMKCDYCYVDRKNVQVMDVATIRKVIDMAVRDSQRSVVGAGQSLGIMDDVQQPPETTMTDAGRLPGIAADAGQSPGITADAGQSPGITADAEQLLGITADAEQSPGIIFFGGEPLLHKDLIYQAIEYGRWKEKHLGTYFHFKITTNGLLLDEDFMEFSLKAGLFIALSHDGVPEAHDLHRKDLNNGGTFDTLSEKIDLLLAAHPYAPVLMTVNPDTVQYYARSVEYLYEKGFKYLICSMNYAGDWDQKSLTLLKHEYMKLADFYYEKALAEEKFYLSPFEVKISSHINRGSYCNERCELGEKQISVGPDGRLYPCVQFVYDEQYSIGDVDTGIDNKKRYSLFSMNEAEKDSCIECAVKERCNHYCGCLNKQSTGSINKVSPVLCAHERILLPIADRLAEKLYKKRNALFIQKHYNDMFPLLSLIEDKTKSTKNNGRQGKIKTKTK